MATLLESFFDDITPQLRKLLEEDPETNIRVDYSGYVYVDGEEGDYGEIRYYLGHVLLATKVIEGGDREHYVWTAEGFTYGMLRLSGFMEQIQNPGA